jgi:hypothetical protein
MPNLALSVICLSIGIVAAGMVGGPGPTMERTYYNVYLPKVSEVMDADDWMAQILDPRDRDNYGKPAKKWHFCKDGIKVDENGLPVIGSDGQPEKAGVPFKEGTMMLELTVKEYANCTKAVSWTFMRDPQHKFHAMEVGNGN